MVASERNLIYGEAGLTPPEIEEVESHVGEKTDGWFMDTTAYPKLFDHFCGSGEMPYLVAKARTGMPDEWIIEQLKEMR